MQPVRSLSATLRTRALKGAVAVGAAAAATIGAAGWAQAPPAAPAPGAAAPATTGPAPAFTERVAGTAVTIDMMAVPGCGDVKPFYAARLELSWELFDAFLYHLDQKSGASTADSDAVTRPTKPYVAVDRGYGHQGWPAISMSSKGAVQFCEWLSKKTGRTYRLPTVAEWQCMAKGSGVAAGAVAEHAWTATDAKNATHKVGSKKADALGLADLWGNVAEWCIASDGGFCVLGGSFKDKAIDPAAVRPVAETEAWNENDPQFPKSVWWLVDGPFIGMRVVTSDAQPAASAPAATGPAK
ncbi:MAG: formylglycine-generating enzyme family protein [Planctomycetes bacterium]|nr:formylglycine-generating enzyme family protein [Planctomycetota bacterium]